MKLLVKPAWIVTAAVFGLAACGDNSLHDLNRSVDGAASSGSSGVAAGVGGSTTGGTSPPSGGAASAGAGVVVNGGESSGGESTAGATGGGWPGGGSASSDGASGAAGAGGTTPYHPCPTNGDVCKILPLGDSITRGHKSSDDGGYRSRLFKLIVAANLKATFTGSLTHGPMQVSGQTFPRTHEGRAGWTIDPGYSPNYSGISSLVPSPALNGDPHIVLLHIGTNDLYFKDSANMAARLEVLIDDIAQNASSALIVLARITPLDSPNAALATYNDKISEIVRAHAAKGQHIIGVDMSKLPVPSGLDDGVHPNDQGYAYMADVWYAAIKDLLPSSK